MYVCLKYVGYIRQFYITAFNYNSAYIQWNLSNRDTNGAEESVIVSEVSSFQRLKCMQEWYLGWEKVSCLERCPQFRSVLVERERGYTVVHVGRLR